MITIKDIAKRARVGVSTVSRVFNEHPDVSSEMRQKVLKIAKQLNYRPNSRARQLVKSKTDTICFIMSNREVINPFHSHILVGVEQYARRLSHDVIFMRFDYPREVPTSELILPRVIWERGTVDGVILAGTNYPNFVRAIKNLDMPFVLFGSNLIGRMSFEDINTVWFDHEGGTKKSSEYLIALGHQQIWFAADLSLPWYRRCYQGYLKAMNEHELKPQRLEVQGGGTPFEYGVDCAHEISKLGEQVSAVVAGDDEIALGVLSGLNRLGIQVPEQISLVGFDELEEMIKYLHPPLTTVSVPKEEVGQEMARVLFERLANPDLRPVKRLIPTELVIRQSCAERINGYVAKNRYEDKATNSLSGSEP